LFARFYFSDKTLLLQNTSGLSAAVQVGIYTLCKLFRCFCSNANAVCGFVKIWNLGVSVLCRLVFLRVEKAVENVYNFLSMYSNAPLM
jgi:hypothetical protein